MFFLKSVSDKMNLELIITWWAQKTILVMLKATHNTTKYHFVLPDDKVWQLDGFAAQSDLTRMEEYRMYVAARFWREFIPYYSENSLF